MSVARPRRAERVAASRGVVALVAVIVALLLAVWLSLAIGAQSIELATVLQALVAPDPNNADHVVVASLRVPRTLAGLVPGAALGAAGAILQSLTRNPLADPGLLGVNAAASLAVVLAISTLGVTSPSAFVWFALLGAIAALALVLAVGALQGEGSSPATVPVVGLALTALCTAGVSIVMLSDRGALSAFRHWQVGSLAARDLDMLAQLAPIFVAGAVLAALSGPALNLLALGDDLARGLGARLGLARAIALGAVVLLCGASVSIVGPIAFIGLVVPHLVRRVTRANVPLTILGSALAGPVLLLVADVVGRVIVPPGELEVGIVVALIGAPALIAHARSLGRGRGARRQGGGRTASRVGATDATGARA